MYRSEEDYLKHIYELSIEQGRQQIKTIELAESLGFSDQSINEKIKKLVQKDYVIFEPYKGVSLTDKGIEEAVRMVRSHRIWEVFLHQELKFPWMDLHDNAEELEHASSFEVIERLYRYLGEPKYCHHGNPIPDVNGVVSKLADKTLFESDVDETFVVNRVMDERALLTLLDKLNIKLGSELKIADKNELENHMTVLLDGKEIQITDTVSKLIFTFK